VSTVVSYLPTTIGGGTGHVSFQVGKKSGFPRHAARFVVITMGLASPTSASDFPQCCQIHQSPIVRPIVLIKTRDGIKLPQHPARRSLGNRGEFFSAMSNASESSDVVPTKDVSSNTKRSPHASVFSLQRPRDVRKWAPAQPTKALDRLLGPLEPCLPYLPPSHGFLPAFRLHSEGACRRCRFTIATTPVESDVDG
jgi:hypothetical protein